LLRQSEQQRRGSGRANPRASMKGLFRGPISVLDRADSAPLTLPRLSTGCQVAARPPILPPRLSHFRTSGFFNSHWSPARSRSHLGQMKIVLPERSSGLACMLADREAARMDRAGLWRFGSDSLEGIRWRRRSTFGNRNAGRRQWLGSTKGRGIACESASGYLLGVPRPLMRAHFLECS